VSIVISNQLESYPNYLPVPGKSRSRRSGRPDSATAFTCPQSLLIGSWARFFYPSILVRDLAVRIQFKGNKPNAAAQKMAPGMNCSKSLLSAGGDVKMPITNATQAQQKIDPAKRNAQCRSFCVSAPSIPSPTNHQAGKQKNGIVTMCQVCTESPLACVRKYDAAGTERGAPMSPPGKLRFTIAWNRRSHTVASENPSQRSRGRINSNCPDPIEAFPCFWSE